MKYTEEQVAALVRASSLLLDNVIDTGEAFPEVVEEWHPVDEDGDAWYSDYFELREALDPFLEDEDGTI